MRNAIIVVLLSGQSELRSSLALFLDRGYLELAKHQTGTVPNLIQIIQEHGVKFLGTTKNSIASPFGFVGVNENGKQVNKGNSVVRTFGTRTNFFAPSRTDQDIWVLVLCHVMGKVQAVRIATNISKYFKNAWVYETLAGKLTRLPNPDIESKPPPDSNEDYEQSTEEQRTKHGWS